MKRHLLPLSCTLVAGALLVSGAAGAQQARSGGGGNQQLVEQLQQLASERTDLRAQNAKLQKDLDDARMQLDALKQQVTAAKSGTAHVAADLATARASIQAEKDNSAKSMVDARAKMQELVDRFRETAGTLRDTENDRAQARQQLVQSKLALDKCAQRNTEISQVTNEVLDRYQHQGALSSLARTEPFSQIKRTQVDNLVLEDRQRVEELRVKDAASPSSAPAR
jgi:chromosome segregation ATPase